MTDERATEVVLRGPLPEAVWRWGHRALWAGLLGSLALTLVVAWRMPEFTLLVPAGLLTLIAGVVLFRYPVVNLGVVLCGFVLAVSLDEGIQVSEVIYGLYLYTYLLHWYGTRFIAGTRIAHTTLDRAIGLFLVVGGGLGIVAGFIFGAPLHSLRGDLTTFLMLGLYFPVKELCRTSRYGPEIVVGALLWLGTFIAVQAFVFFRAVVRSATVAYQVADVRFTLEPLLVVAALAALTLLLFAHRWRDRVGLAGLFLFVLGALILTRGRTFWVAFALGVVLLLLLLRGHQRVRLVGLAGVGSVALIVVTSLFFGRVAVLIFSGTLTRLAMIGTGTKDLSMLSRIFEWRAVWDYIAVNPVLGYGFGTKYQYFDILAFATISKGFIHNGYLAVWYKLGVFGLALFLFIWGRGLYESYRACRACQNQSVPQRHQAFALIAFTSLAATSLSANASIFFLVMDQFFSFTLLIGLAAGLYQRYDSPSGVGDSLSPPSATP